MFYTNVKHLKKNVKQSKIMITTKLIFDRRGTASRTREGYIEVRMIHQRKAVYISTGVRVYQNEWAAGRIVNRPDADVLNTRVALIYEKVCEEINRCMAEDKPLDADAIKTRALYAIDGGSDEPTFMNWFERQIGLLTLTPGTVKHYRSLKVRLEEFGRIRRWVDVTAENIYELDSWLHQRQTKTGRKISDAAVYKYHKCLKAMLNKAYQFGRIDNNPYNRIRFKRGERQSMEYLTESEMRAFENLQLPEGTQLAISHDLFVFQMYTGLSFSDMQAFDFSKYRKVGDTWQHTGERIKTGVPFVSQLLPPAVMVLEKYGFRIPKIDNADYNHNLKALGVMAGIQTPLHSHLARHTFATWMLRNGAKIENVSKMLGHTNITQTQRYSKVLAESVHEDFNKVAANMEKKNRTQ
jgi:site-specific recombinase XerD